MVKYYKKVTVEKDWTQPVLTSNPQNGYQIIGSNYSGDLKVLSDGVINNTYISPTTTAQYGCVINYSFPKILKISKIGVNHYSQTNVTYGFSSFKIVGIMHGKEVTIAIPSLPAGSGWYTDEFAVDNLRCNGIKIYCSGHGSPHPRLGEITITATEQTQSWQPCTKEEYDSLPDDERKIVRDIYSAFIKSKTLHKEIIEKDWTQPILNSNGTLGGDSFAVWADTDTTYNTQAYQSFNANTSDAWHPYGLNKSIGFYTPNPVKIGNIHLIGGTLNTQMQAGTLYYSYDNINYIKLKDWTINGVGDIVLQDNSIFAQYYKITVTNGTPDLLGGHHIGFTEITITAIEKTETWQECTKEEYDNLPDDQRKIVTGYYTFQKKNENVNYIC